ncbi:hypothetical protein ColKHC_14281 [Colletotrichum higginsianum]|nr:hypothetical protein ColKHC_14281 [Colletotrichum higginsianum]
MSQPGSANETWSGFLSKTIDDASEMANNRTQHLEEALDRLLRDFGKGEQLLKIIGRDAEAR